MIKLIVLALLTTLIQDAQSPKIDRVFVTTPYNTSIIYEYANRLIPEEKAFTDELGECFISRLKATGLFKDVQIKVKATEERQRVQVEVIPEWDQAIENFEISELTFEGFNDSDRIMLGQHLRKQGEKLASDCSGTRFHESGRWSLKLPRKYLKVIPKEKIN